MLIRTSFTKLIAASICSMHLFSATSMHSAPSFEQLRKMVTNPTLIHHVLAGGPFIYQGLHSAHHMVVQRLLVRTILSGNADRNFILGMLLLTRPYDVKHVASLTLMYLCSFIVDLNKPNNPLLRDAVKKGLMIDDIRADLALPSNLQKEIEDVLAEMDVDTNLLLIARNKDQDAPAHADYCSINFNPKLSDQCTKRERRIIIGHEAWHYINDDYIKTMGVLFMLPILTHYGFKGCAYLGEKILGKYDLIRHATYPSPAELLAGTLGGIGYALTQLLFAGKLPVTNNETRTGRFCTTVAPYLSALHKYMGTTFLLSYFNRRKEQRADIQSATTLACAQDAIDHFVRLQNILLEKVKRNPSLASDVSIEGDDILDDQHPSFSERIVYLTLLAREQAEKKND